jgi:hypothetical protein
MTTNIEEHSNTEAGNSTRAPEVPVKANVAPHKPRVAPAKGKSGKKASRAKKATKGAKAAKRAKPESSARQGSKTAKVVDLLRRPGGATLGEVMKATGWQPHSVRGFISGTLGKKMGLKVNSTKGEGGERSYSVKG